MTAPGLQQGVFVLDFGGRHAQIVARKVRECKVYSEILPYDTSVEEIRKLCPSGLILSGGPSSVLDEGAPTCDPAVFSLGVPILGIGYGMQLICRTLGGVVERTGAREDGDADLTVTEEGILFEELPLELSVWMDHNDRVVQAPAGFFTTANTPGSPIAAMENTGARLYGVQFHPESAHTPHGTEMLKNFLYRGCDCLPSWTTSAVIDDSVASVRETVGNNKIICGLSGGVDSSVAAVLVHKAVGDQLTCVFVDHGLLRKGEAEEVIETFGRHFEMNLIHVDASTRFMKKLAGITDPEAKRKAIGEEFIRVFEEEAHKLKDTDFLVQGTLYPDIIESGTKDAVTVKSHHNVGGLPEDMQFELVEPLRLLFKDEVRAVGEELGLPEEIVWRQPFPGPGLAVRIIGEVTFERCEVLREADAIVTEEIRRADLYREIWQSFAVLPCIRSVGVTGGARTYAYPIILRAVKSDDAMTAEWARIPYDVLERISTRIINEVDGINRVAYDISSKPPATIEWE